MGHETRGGVEQSVCAAQVSQSNVHAAGMSKGGPLRGQVHGCWMTYLVRDGPHGQWVSSEGDERRPLPLQQQPVHLHARGQCEDRAASLRPALGQQVPLRGAQFPQHTSLRLIGALLPLGLSGGCSSGVHPEGSMRGRVTCWDERATVSGGNSGRFRAGGPESPHNSTRKR